MARNRHIAARHKAAKTVATGWAPVLISLLMFFASNAIAQPAGGSFGAATQDPNAGRVGRSIRTASPGETDALEAPLFYSTAPSGILFRTADTSKPYMSLAFHEQLSLLRDDGDWAYVQTRDGGRGYVGRKTISNVWIRVSKSKKTVFVYEGSQLIHEIPADLAYNFFSDKVRQGSVADPDHWRTPEGKFFVVSRNPESAFYKAFVLNYPSREHAERGLASGLITQSQYTAIARAEEKVQPPPMNTPLGGLIEIHGGGTGARTSWTQGCIAIPNSTMDDLWQFVQVGTPVLIES